MKKIHLSFIAILMCYSFFGQQFQIIADIKTDTTLVSDNNLSSSSYPGGFTELNGELIFCANDPYNITALPMGIYKSNGNVNGTNLVFSMPQSYSILNNDSNISSYAFYNNEPRPFELVGNNLLFKVGYYQNGWHYSVWKTDGFTSGTMFIEDLNSKVFCSNLCEMNGYIYYITTFTDPVWGNVTHELYKIDGTSNGAILVQSWVNSIQLGPSNNIIAFNNKIYFAGIESDGTTNGTIYTGVNLPAENESCILNGKIYYKGPNGNLWKTDGTISGTLEVANYPVTGGDLYSSNGWIYFSGGFTGVGLPGNELSRSDGSSANTYMIKDINLGFNSSSPHDFISIGSEIFFTASGEINNCGIWKTDGSEIGTVLVKGFPENIKDLIKHDNQLYFTHYSYPNGYRRYEIWKTNGESQNTYFVQAFDTIASILEVNCNLFISADDTNGYYFRNTELWCDTSFCTTSNVINLIKDQKIIAFPNPTTSSVTIKVPAEFVGKCWSLYDQMGRLQQSGVFTSTESEINLEAYNPGIYIMRSDETVPIKIIKE